MTQLLSWKVSNTCTIKALLAVCMLSLVTCSQDQEQGPEEKTVDPQRAVLQGLPNLIDITRPNPDTMEADVAKLVDEAWITLDGQLRDATLEGKQKAQAFADFGLVAFGNGLVLPAESAFANAANLVPDEPRWVYFLALLHEYDGDLEKAAQGFESVLALQPDSLPAHLRLADVRFEQAKLELSKQHFSRALLIEPNNAAALYGLGRVAHAEQDYELAAKHFKNALEQQPSASRINYFLGMTWRNLGDREKAQSYLGQRGTVEPSFNDPLFDEISGGEARIDGLWAHMNAGSQALVDGNYQLAVDEFRLATADLPEDYRSWQSLGMALNRVRDISGAKDAYEKALELDQKNATIYHELAKIELVSREFKSAESQLQSAIEIDPGMLDAHKTYARMLLNSGRTDEALDRYEQALALDPQSGELAVSRAQTLAALGRNEEATNALRASTQTNPLDMDVRMAFGLLLAEQGQLDQATEEIELALSGATDDFTKGRAHYALGQVHVKKRDPNSAISSFGSALRLNPKHNAAGLELARSFLRIKDYPQALATYEAHIGYWPESDTNRVEAARVAVMLGDGTKAKIILDAGSSNGAATARLLGTYARLLILSTDPVVKNPSKALDLANLALSKSKQPQHYETLALSYAANGNYNSAVDVQEKIVKSTNSNTITRVKTRMERNLQRYRSRTLGRLPFDAS